MPTHAVVSGLPIERPQGAKRARQAPSTAANAHLGPIGPPARARPNTSAIRCKPRRQAPSQRRSLKCSGRPSGSCGRRLWRSLIANDPNDLQALVRGALEIAVNASWVRQHSVGVVDEAHEHVGAAIGVGVGISRDIFSQLRADVTVG